MNPLSKLTRAPLLNESRPVTYLIVFGIWAEVFLYCLLHDQYMVRVAPTHFTVYHEPLWGIENHSLLAAAWAFRASVGPGLVLGLAALFLGRAGSRPKIAPRTMLKIVPCLILLTEISGLSAGLWAWRNERPLYPDAVYPDGTLPILFSQTNQVTCYLVGGLVSAGFLAWIIKQRRSLSSMGGAH